MLKLFLVYISVLSTSAFAIDICSQEYLGLQSMVKESQLNRVNKMNRIEKLVQLIRSGKSNANLVEADRKAVSSMIKHDHYLYEGNTFLAEKTLRPLFREYEVHYHKFLAHSDLLNSVRRVVKTEPDDLLEVLLLQYKDDPFVTELLVNISKSRFANTDKLMNELVKRMNHSAGYLGRNWVEYRIAVTHLNDVISSKACSAICKKKIRALQKELGVSGTDEKHRFPFLVNLSSPALNDVRALINSVPRAYESSIMAEGFQEIMAILRDFYTLPNFRKALSKTLAKTIPSRYKETINSIDAALNDIGAYSNHFPIINRTLRSQKTVANRFDRLRNQNVMYPNDELLETFARRVDQRARDGWSEFKAHAKNTDESFHARMLAAEEKAKLKVELSNDYRKSPFRSFVYIVATASIYPLYGMFFDVDVSEITEIIDSGDIEDHIEIITNDENPELMEIHLKSEEATELVTDMMEPVLESIKSHQEK